jgi:hypothetical protein
MTYDWRAEIDEACGPLSVDQIDAGMVIIEKAQAAALREAAEILAIPYSTTIAHEFLRRRADRMEMGPECQHGRHKSRCQACGAEPLCASVSFFGEKK